MLERPEPDGRLGDAAVHEDGEAAVEAPDAVLPHCLLGAVGDPLVLADLLIQLQLGLDVLGGIGDADLNTTGNTSRYDTFQCLHEEII